MGNLELNVFKPLILHNFLQSVRLLSGAISGFDYFCARGLQPNLARIAALVENSLMLVTALTPHIGYDQAAAIAKHAQKSGSSLRVAALALGTVSEAQFDAWVGRSRYAEWNPSW
jgi:fumarate hydratase class II